MPVDQSKVAFPPIFDLALYQQRPGRSRAIERYARAARPNAGSDGALVLQAMCRARFGLWRVVGQHHVCGIVVSDLLDDSGDGEQVWVVDEIARSDRHPWNLPCQSAVPA